MLTKNSKSYKAILQKEISEIYKFLISHHLEDSNGVYWRNNSSDNEIIIKEDIYSGVSGIMIFLMAYSSQFENNNCKDFIFKTMTWLLKYCKENPTDNYSFYTGRTGTILTIIRAAKLYNRKDVIEESLILLHDIKKYAKKKDLCNDFLLGLSGTILGLLHIYHETKSKFCIEILKPLIEILRKKARCKKDKTFWDTPNFANQPLCGLSHGNSGIGFVFLELGNYFSNEEFMTIARQAFNYENQFFNYKENNWPDFRNSSNVPSEPRQIYNYPSSWCHGAPGIGLIRIRAFEILGSAYASDLISVGKNILAVRYSNLPDCICHGVVGNFSFFLEMFKRTKKKKYHDLYMSACIETIKRKRRNGSYISGSFDNKKDLSLFLGISGVGFSFIQALSPFKIFSWQLPILNIENN